MNHLQLDDDFETRLLRTLRGKAPGVSDGELRRRIESTMEFLTWCAIPGAPPLGPCPEVDDVWHEMILFTASYRQLCGELGVGFIDHEPIENPGAGSPSAARTLAFVRSRGIEPRHPAMWSFSGAARCCGGHAIN